MHLKKIILFLILPVLSAEASYPPDFFQYGRFNNFIYNPAYVGSSGVFTGSYYMANNGVLLGFELSPKNWNNSIGYVFDHAGGRHNLAWNHRIKLGGKTYLRLGLSGSFLPINSIQYMSTGFGAMLGSGNFKAGASINDFLQIGNELVNPISSIYTISYDLKGDYVLWMPQFSYYTNYHSAYSIVALNAGVYNIVGGGALVIYGNSLFFTLNGGVRIKNSALLIGLDGFPINGVPSIYDRFHSYHLMLRIQL